MLQNLVTEFQCGGLQSREIHEGVLITNELIDYRLKSKEPGVIMKLDFRKIFDMVSWSFHDKLLESFGFGRKWRN